MSDVEGFKGLLLFFFLFVILECRASSFRNGRPFVGKVLYSESVDSQAVGRRGARALRPGSLLFIGEKIYSRSGFLKIRLREGNNEILLTDHSLLSIDQASAAGRLNGTRLSLKKGAARFMVKAQYSGRGSDRFQVKTPSALIEALGTVFVVSVDPSTQVTTTATLEGSTLTKSFKVADATRSVRVGFTNSVSNTMGTSEPVSILKSEVAKAVVAKLSEGSNYTLAQIRVAELDNSRAKTLRDRIDNGLNGDGSADKQNNQDPLRPSHVDHKSRERGSDALEKLLVRALGI